MVQTLKSVSWDSELQKKLENTISEMNKVKIDGKLTQSKIIRISVNQFCDRIADVKRFREELENE